MIILVYDKYSMDISVEWIRFLVVFTPRHSHSTNNVSQLPLFGEKEAPRFYIHAIAETLYNNIGDTRPFSTTPCDTQLVYWSQMFLLINAKGESNSSFVRA